MEMEAAEGTNEAKETKLSTQDLTEMMAEVINESKEKEETTEAAKSATT
jgi:hypothetical protein